MDIPRHWRLRKQRYGLVGEVCEHCDAKVFPPRDICPECGQEKEIFSDEFDRAHKCSACGNEIDFTQCKLEGEATSSSCSSKTF